MGPKKLSNSLNLDLQTAYDIHNTWFSTYHKMAKWQEKVRAFGEEHGYVVNKWGRRMAVGRYWHTDDEGNTKLRSSSYTLSPALLGQSSTTEVIKDGLLKMPRWLQLCVVSPVHDALVFVIPNDRVDEARQEIVRCMEQTIEGIDFPVTVGPAADNWWAADHEWPEEGRESTW